MLQGDRFCSYLKNSDVLSKILTAQSLHDNSIVEALPNSVSLSSKSDPSLDSDHFLPLPKRSKPDREHKRNGRRKMCKEDSLRETVSLSKNFYDELLRMIRFSSII